MKTDHSRHTLTTVLQGWCPQTEEKIHIRRFTQSLHSSYLGNHNTWGQLTARHNFWPIVNPRKLSKLKASFLRPERWRKIIIFHKIMTSTATELVTQRAGVYKMSEVHFWLHVTIIRLQYSSLFQDAKRHGLF